MRKLLKLGTTVADQLLLSGISFLTGFVLIRRTSDLDYGMFVLVQSSILLLVSAQSAWVSSPLTVLGPARPPELRQKMIGAIDASQRKILRWIAAIALLAPPIGYCLNIWAGLESVVIAIAIVAGWAAVQRDFVRNILLIYLRPESMLFADCCYAAILLLGVIIISTTIVKPAVVWAVSSLAVAAIVGESVGRNSLKRNPGWVPGHAALFWREMRPLAFWSTTGAVIYWLFSQSYNYILATRVNLTSVAEVNAIRLILMPTIILTNGLQRLLAPTAAVWLAQSDLGHVVRRLLLCIAGFGTLDIIYFVIAWNSRDWITHDFMHKVIADRDRLLILWALVFMFSFLREISQIALFALGHFKVLAFLTGASAVVALTLMWFGIQWWGPQGAIIGQMAGEVCSVIGIIVLITRALRTRHARSNDPSRPP